MQASSSTASSAAQPRKSPQTRRKTSPSQPTRSILFTHRTIRGMPSSAAIAAWRRLWVSRPSRGVDEHDREVGRRGAGDHVARVLRVPGRVGDDEAAPGGGEVAVGDVDRDALLALGPQPVGQQREVEAVVAARGG